jgi:demethylmenaquinone methyltransferase / 2-methoxy-6-polyprenyl-1,4-benzoquinol methylase
VEPRLLRDPAYLRDLFGRNAPSYDRVNKLISFGLVGGWRRAVVEAAAPRPGERVLDAFAGPGSLSLLAAPRLGSGGEVVLVDLSPAMLQVARSRLRRTLGASPASAAAAPHLRFVSADLLDEAPNLGTFDVVLLGFALRYAPSSGLLLRRLSERLRPGGRLALLEFGSREAPRESGTPLAVEARRLVSAGARLFFHTALPALAGRLAPGREVYDYLSDSTEQTLSAAELKSAVEATGLRTLSYRPLLGGLVVLLVAEKG